VERFENGGAGGAAPAKPAGKIAGAGHSAATKIENGKGKIENGRSSP
jgi:hypothetical protein